MKSSLNIRKIWYWDIEGTPEVLWPYVTDTRRINEDSGVFEQFKYTYKHDEEGIVFKQTKKNLRGKNHTFKESPFEWEYPNWYQVTRDFHTSPIKKMWYRVSISPKTKNISRVTYELEINARNLISKVILEPYLNLATKRGLNKSFQNIKERIKQSSVKYKAIADPIKKFDAHTENLSVLLEKTQSSEEFKRAVEFAILHWPESELLAIRPYVFADAFDLPRKDTLIHFLSATVAGIFELEWRMFCPSCHGSAEQSEHRLSDLRGDAYCPACHISYEALFDKGIEATFTPKPSVRNVSGEVFCTGGPKETRHILFQKILQANEEYSFKMNLKPGIYGLFSKGFELESQIELVSKTNQDPENDIRLNQKKPDTSRVMCEQNQNLRIINGDEITQIQLHHITDLSDIATAAEVTTIPEFRKRFSSQLIQSGERFGVSNIVILFTDLRESTKLYSSLGDVEAISRIQQHFGILRKGVEQKHGSVIKTIGDAVMGIFHTPADAIMGCYQIINEIHADNKNFEIPLNLKMGLHCGEAFALTYDEKIDYFGSTINFCSRLEKLTEQHHLVITEALYHKTGIATVLKEVADDVSEFEHVIKGISSEPQKLYKVRFKIKS